MRRYDGVLSERIYLDLILYLDYLGTEKQTANKTKIRLTDSFFVLFVGYPLKSF